MKKVISTIACLGVLSSPCYAIRVNDIKQGMAELEILDSIKRSFICFKNQIDKKDDEPKEKDCNMVYFVAPSYNPCFDTPTSRKAAKEYLLDQVNKAIADYDKKMRDLEVH